VSYGKITSESDFSSSGTTYFQGWVPASPGTTESRLLDGLRPGDTLIFAVKAGDESPQTRWSALGAEPLVVVPGDTVTPHTVGIGQAGGCIKDFLGNERIDSRGGDQLYSTWDDANVYFGYNGCDWRSEGDLQIYVDCRPGGSTMTYNYHGSLPAALAPGLAADYCLVLEDNATAKLMAWDEGEYQWMDYHNPYNPGSYSLDGLNGYSYAEIRLNFVDLGYDPSQPFGYLVVAQNETDDDSWNAFPVSNPIGKGKLVPAEYPYHYSIPNGLQPGQSPRVVTGARAVELSQLAAAVDDQTVQLAWRTESEQGIDRWLVDRSADGEQTYATIATVEPMGTAAAGHTYVYSDRDVIPATTYHYRLGDRDQSGITTWHGPVMVTTPELAVRQLWLGPGRPNPAVGAADISYAVPAQGNVLLVLYDICGRQVRTLVRAGQRPGRYAVRWDGRNDAGLRVSPGVYFYRLAAGGGALTRRLTYLR
jgi:hypothetical protein